jgi:hypothetical protein
MVMVFGDHLREIIMKVNGSKTGNMEREYLNIVRVLIKVNLKTFLRMESDNRFLLMETDMRVPINKEDPMGKENILGSKVDIMKGSLIKV